MDSVLLGKWRLIGRKDADAIPCDICGAGISKVEAGAPVVSRNESLHSRFT